uniref:Aftiphilin clathrin-binding box domain-containing protein n=1 Tax=Setaria digitata TaxID=48799 RepID=A0A915PJP3_9BILA
MFEDDPPPLPIAPCTETSGNGTFADLNDENRFTAVADDDSLGQDEECRSHISPPFPAESEFVSPSIATPHSELAEVNSAQNLITITLLHNDSDGGQNSSSLALLSPCSQFAQIPKPLSLMSQVSQCPENPDVLKSPVTPCSIQAETSVINLTTDFPNSSFQLSPSVITKSADKDRDTTIVSRAVQHSRKGNKDSISVEITENERKGSSDLSVMDLINENDEVVVAENKEDVLDEDDDEFGDFEEFAARSAEQTEKSGNENWANFEASSFFGKNQSVESVSSSEESRSTDEVSVLPTLLKNFCDEQLWVNGNGDDKNSDDHSILDSGVYETLSDAINRKDEGKPDEMIWVAVSIIEEALALKLQWHHSSIRSHFLHSLDIDPNKAVVRNSGLPVFAQQLEKSAVLAPTSAVESCTGIALVGEKSPLPQSNSVEFLPHARMERCAVTQQTPVNSVTVDSLAVPPAQFDWSNFGLTNPLKTGTLSVSSTSLDLDFLASTNSKGPAGDGLSTVQDLAAFGLNLSDDGKNENEKVVSRSTPTVLDCLLNKHGEKRKYTPVSELSLDARALHDQLPDLDYMLSNVLLFPVVDR